MVEECKEIPRIWVSQISMYKLIGCKYTRVHKNYHNDEDDFGNYIYITVEECIVLIDKSVAASPDVSEYVKLTLSCCTHEIYAAVLLKNRYDLLMYLLQNTERDDRRQMIDILSSLYHRTKCSLVKDVVVNTLKNKDFHDYCRKDTFTYPNIVLLLEQ